jgi:DnaD/phage-associated family protein
MNNLPWFRFYSEALNDRKMARAVRISGQPKAVVLGVWLVLLCLANDSPERGRLMLGEDLWLEEDEILAETGLDPVTYGKVIGAFQQLNMVAVGRGYELPNWDKRQYKSDNSSARVARYRQKRVDSGMTVSPSYDSSEILARDNHTCVYCGATSNLCVDHIYPITLGGTDDELNLATACKQCNSGKAGRTPEQAGYKIKNVTVRDNYARYSVTVTGATRNSDSNAIDTEQIQNRTDADDAAAVFDAYAQLCGAGAINKKLADEIGEFIDEVGAQTVLDAIHEAAVHNGKSWAYVRKILVTWRDKGRGSGKALANGDAWAHVEALVKAGTPPEPDDPVYGAVKRVGWGKLKQMTDYDAPKLRKQFEAVMA